MPQSTRCNRCGAPFTKMGNCDCFAFTQDKDGTIALIRSVTRYPVVARKPAPNPNKRVKA